ncbi:MAG: GNAT family N-acetyltransferase [Clostridiales bacterium]|nr:GNAT family N-acetyltransferase [Clostridiales bacterium]
MEIKIIPKEDYNKMSQIQQAAYASSFKGTKDEIKILSDIFSDFTDNGDIRAIGAYDGETMLGCVLYYDFQTNFHQEIITTAGIGSLAVDLLHKKKHVAHALINHSFELARQEGSDLYYLYPFSTKFYRNFGFGYGSPMYTYCVAPKDFVDKGDKSILSYGSESDYEKVFELHDTLAKNTQGMSMKTYGDKRRIREMKMGKLVLAKDKEELIGYLIYTQKGLSESNNQSQKMVIAEMFYSNSKALNAFGSFFNSQKDQMDYIQIATHDGQFQQLLNNTCFVPEPKTMDIISLKVADKSLGLMPYALEPQNLLNRLKVELSHQLSFTIKHPRSENKTAVVGQGDPISITLTINEFSSWITGVITLKELFDLGQLKSDHPELLRKIDQQMYFESPKSLTRF